MGKGSQLENIIVGAIVGALIGASVTATIFKSEYKIKNPEPGYVHEIQLRKEDANKNKHEEMVLTIEGKDYHIKKTPEGYKLTPFDVIATTTFDGDRCETSYKIEDINQ